MDRRLDPRSIVTPYAFAVHPDLIGRPLATPWQRLGAILVDLLLIFLLSNQVPGMLLALGSAALLVWLAIRKPGRDVFGKLFRVFVGCLGVIVLFVTLLIIFLVSNADELERLGERVDSVTGGELVLGPGSEGNAGIGDILGVIQGATAFRGVESREEAQVIADRLAASAFGFGLPREEIRASLNDLVPEDASWAPYGAEIVEEAMASLPPEGGEPGRTAAAREGAEPEAREAATPVDAPVSGAITDPLALDSIAALSRQLAAEREARSDAEERAEAAQRELRERGSGGFLSWLYGIIDDLGLGFGWGALYLTVTHAWWKGTSVGKRLFRIRVVMIDQRPLNWWLSFERAGGYAAGFATGLLGFAQIFWDPNRQAIHDKVSETIVVQDGKAPVPGPWIDEGRAMWASRGDRAGEHPRG